MCVPPHSSLVDDVHEDRPFQVWRRNPDTMTWSAAAASADPELGLPQQRSNMYRTSSEVATCQHLPTSHVSLRLVHHSASGLA
jgi:hypothetical protein